MITAHRIKNPPVEVPQPAILVHQPDDVAIVLSWNEAQTLRELSGWAGTVPWALNKALTPMKHIDAALVTQLLDRIATALYGVLDK